MFYEGGIILFNRIFKLLTSNGKKIPLLRITLNIHKFREKSEGSCMLNYHPTFKNDKYLQEKAFEIIDYIRNKYDMEELLK